MSKATRFKEKQQIINEYILTSLSQHPNIIQFHKIYDYSGNISIIHEIIRYPLTKLISTNFYFPPRVLNYILKEILQALVYLHSCHRIHRDLRTENVLIDENSKIKLAGMRKAAQLTQEKVDRNTITGSFSFFSPEMIANERYGTKTDIWSFGVLVIEIMEGEPPSLRKSQKEAFKRIENGGLGFKNPENVEGRYRNFVQNCLKVNPDERMTAKELLGDEIFEDVAQRYEVEDCFFRIMNRDKEALSN